MTNRRDPEKQQPRHDGRRVTDRPGQRWYSTADCAALMACGIKDGFVRGCIEEGLWSARTGGLVKLEALRRVTRTAALGDYSVRDVWLYVFLKAVQWPWLPAELASLEAITSVSSPKAS